ncbi:hypothetical protein GAYE_PCTG32G0846 [Galdieria yellowstonensis]|uniref:HNH nuclease domain-containing protein n=1 Tax=Galdieria yellowstonensis TaxID=3028027 RepID=A0AAV9I3H9_9RHOD|nr:hypothetical protein GAYE_PCTG32G0846 [Galdieria yellowstonensis]
MQPLSKVFSYIKIPIWKSHVFHKDKTKNGVIAYERFGSRQWLVISFKPIRKCNIFLEPRADFIFCCSSSPSLAVSEKEDNISFNYYQLYNMNPAETTRSSTLVDLHKLEKDPQASPESFPTLVLNADFQPVSYYPLSLWPWYETIKAVLLEKVVVLETYEKVIRSPSLSLQLPSVVALKEFRKLTGREPIFTRFNVFLRDDFVCQYCGKRYSCVNLSFDHIIPRSRGGRSCWTNVVTACFPCNFKKGSRLIEETKDMKLLKYPKRPTFYELQVKAKKLAPKISHTTWKAYLAT